jgi:opacity protein-like surface antigen
VKRRVLVLALCVVAVVLAAALPASAVSTVVLKYNAKEKSGTVAHDISGYHNRGSLHQIKLNGAAFQFNGKTSYVRTPTSDSINPRGANFSYAVTINIPQGTTFNHDYSLVRRGSSKMKGAYFKMEMVYKRATGHMRLECAFRDQGGRRAIVSTGGTALKDGEWHTLTCRKTATTVSLTKDDTTYSNHATLRSMSSTIPMYFGAEYIDENTFWEHFAGQMKNITLTKG